MGLADELAERALQNQGFCGKDAGGFDGAGVFFAQPVDVGGGLVSIVRTDTCLANTTSGRVHEAS